jgi:hypothetical protein
MRRQDHPTVAFQTIENNGGSAHQPWICGLAAPGAI